MTMPAETDDTSTDIAPVEPEIAGSTAIIQVIERAALNPDIDVEKMERLLAMHERILERNAEQAFNEAMRNAQEEMPQVLRNAENQQTRSRYATYEVVNRAIKPVVTKHGFAMSFGTDQAPLDNHYRITCRVSHTAGFSRDYHADVPADTVGMKGNQNKTATHGFGSTMSYGRRYLTLLIFDVALTDDDDDGNGAAAKISDDQKERLIQLMRETQADTAKFLGWLGVPDIDALPAERFNQAVRALEAKRAKL